MTLTAGAFSDGSALHSTALGDQHRRLLLAVASDEVYRAPNDGRSGLWACYRLGDVDVSPAAAASVALRLGARAPTGAALSDGRRRTCRRAVTQLAATPRDRSQTACSTWRTVNTAPGGIRSSALPSSATTRV